jgi:hypothetical protein
MQDPMIMIRETGYNLHHNKETDNGKFNTNKITPSG